MTIETKAEPEKKETKETAGKVESEIPVKKTVRTPRKTKKTDDNGEDDNKGGNFLNIFIVFAILFLRNNLFFH